VEADADELYNSPQESSENDENFDHFYFHSFSQSGATTDTVTSFDHPLETWCKCGSCTDCTGKEAICCQSKDGLTNLMDSVLQCITSTDLFNGLLSEELEYSRFTHASAIRESTKRQEYLAKEMTNGLK
jgi:hypothetical protein